MNDLELPASSSEPILYGQEPVGKLALADPPASELLPKLNLEDYVPSVHPWISLASSAIVISGVLAVLFAAWCPYRVIVRAPGTVRTTVDEVIVNAPLAGRIVQIFARSNQSVKAGDPLFSFDSTPLEGEIIQGSKSLVALQEQQNALRAQILSDQRRAELEVQKSGTELDLAQSELESYAALQAQGAESRRFYEQKKAAFGTARAIHQQAKESLDALRSQARIREAELRKEASSSERVFADAKRGLENTIVRAPVDGIIFKLDVESLQQTVGSGQPLATITPNNVDFLIRVDVRSEDVSRIKTDQNAGLKLAACPFTDYGTLPATVVSVAPDISAASGSYLVTLKPQRVQLVDKNGKRCSLKPGMPLQADIVTQEETLLRFILRSTRLWVG